MKSQLILFLLLLASFGAQAQIDSVFAKTAEAGLADGTSWADAMTLHNALAKPMGMFASRRIFVAVGTYLPDSAAIPTDRALSFQMRDNVSIYGGYQGNAGTPGTRNINTHVTIFSGDLNNDDMITDVAGTNSCSFANRSDNSYHVLTADATITGQITVSGITIQRGHANGAGMDEDKGGGIFVKGVNQITFIQMTVKHNFATLRGGGAYFDNFTTIIFNTNTNTFTCNTTNGTGGAIHLENGTTFTINNNSTFSNNQGDRGGAVFIEQTTTVAINVGTFEDNQAQDSGGGVYNHIGGTVTVSGTMRRNKALTNHGGGIYTETLTTFNSNINYETNSATEKGGGIYIVGDGTTNVNGGTNTNNTAKEGAVVYANKDADATVNIPNGVYQTNTAVDKGGAICIVRDIVTLNNFTVNIYLCRFSGNQATAATSMGGAIYNSANMGTIYNCIFSCNVAAFGGAEANEFAALPIEINNTISGNSAQTNGGGLYYKNVTNANCATCKPMVINTILWKNMVGVTEETFFNDASSTVAIELDFNIIGETVCYATWATCGANMKYQPANNPYFWTEANFGTPDYGDFRLAHDIGVPRALGSNSDDNNASYDTGRNQIPNVTTNPNTMTVTTVDAPRFDFLGYPRTCGNDRGAIEFARYFDNLTGDYNVNASWSVRTGQLVPDNLHNIVVDQGICQISTTDQQAYCALLINNGTMTMSNGRKLTLRGGFRHSGLLFDPGNDANGGSTVIIENDCNPMRSLEIWGSGNPVTNAHFFYNLIIRNNNGAASPSYSSENYDGQSVGLNGGSKRIIKVADLKDGNLHTGGLLRLLSDASNTAMLINDPAETTVTTGVTPTTPNRDTRGNVGIQRYMPSYTERTTGEGYNYVASPVFGATVASVADDFTLSGTNTNYKWNCWLQAATASNPFPNFYWYDETLINTAIDAACNTQSNDKFEVAWRSYTSNAMAMESMRGYCINVVPAFTLDYSGEVHNGTMTLPLSYTNAGAINVGWQLIGNPYPSPISWTAIRALSNNVDGTIYRRIATTKYLGTFAYFTAAPGAPPIGILDGGDNIASGQGFLVRATGAGASLTMNNTVRPATDPDINTVGTYLNPRMFKTEDQKEPMLANGVVKIRIKASNNLVDETAIYFHEKATKKVEGLYDAYKFWNSNPAPSLFTRSGNTMLAVNAQPTFRKEAEIPLHIYSAVAGQHTITLQEMDLFAPNTGVFVMIKKTNEMHNLNAKPFTFNFAQAGAVDSTSYTIRIVENALNSETGDFATAEIYPNPSVDKFTLRLRSSFKGAMVVRILDTNGKVVRQLEMDKKQTLLQFSLELGDLPLGVYIAEITGGDGDKLVRRIIKL